MLNKTALWLFLTIAGLPSLSSGQDSLLLRISPLQVQVINGTYIYARECQEIKQELLVQAAMADTIIQGYKAEVGALRQQISALKEKDVVREDNIKFLEKSLKKEKRRKIGNKILLSSIIVIEGMAIGYLLLK